MRSVSAATLVAAGCAALAAFASLASGRSTRDQLTFRRIAGGFAEPVYVAQPKNEPGRLYVVERAGRIIALANGRRSSFLDIRGRVESGYEEQGLLSIAFTPAYARNHRFYVYYTNRRGDIEVDTFLSRRGRAVVASRRRVLLVPHRENDNHDGGQLQFGPDGLLYAGTGDGGAAGDPPNNSQSLSRRLGKLLRYSHGSWHVAAYGLRNPWRFSFDRANGDLYVGDVGQGKWEEVDYRTRAQLGRRWNFGWARYEGDHHFKDGPFSSASLYVPPVAEYPHSGGSCSITGGYVYRGRAIPSFRGRYVYGDYCSGIVWSLRISGGRAVEIRRERFKIPELSSFGEDLAGELYATSLGGRV
ncbi:MAG TPA: PQQ-dependent sugar dehydrogenase, partial [Gaiellaceae bacterium]|nr:PQQ-dependent sugar dehydrogenase [Gaiellaceae bacterium]